MRFKSEPVEGFQVYAVTGTNTISFAIVSDDKVRQALLGFTVKRSMAGGPERTMPGFKVFKSIVPKPTPTMQISTWNHPMQSFVWDDFTGTPNQKYEYNFIPVRGTPGQLQRGTPVTILVQTEKLYSTGEHDVFFNRGVASSQAYRRKFGNKKPDQLPPDKKTEALKWLRRDLDAAILRFIASAKKGDSLLGCFYEFHYSPIVKAFKTAHDNGVRVQVIIDAKVNERRDRQGFHPSFPRTENFDAIKRARIPKSCIIERDANPNNIQHNKFMILLRGGKPMEVFTGSTNLSLGGITGQTNVGHWVRNAAVARRFQAYWNLLKTNPGSKKREARTESVAKKKTYRLAVEKLADVPKAVDLIKSGICTVFSPRTGETILDVYSKLLDSKRESSCSCVTLAFGVNKWFKKDLSSHTRDNSIVFMLLEKKDEPNERSKLPFVALKAANSVYEAWGSFIKDPVYQWARETTNRQLQFNSHVSYIHSKFLLKDPLGNDPIVVTGSANFSKASTNDNDENMLIIRGNRRVADIYFTEFNRLFNHYYFRAVHEVREGHDSQKVTEANLFLDETGNEWQKQYAPGKLRAKRLALYQNMKGV